MPGGEAVTAELRRLLDEATPGPWTHRLNQKPYRIVVFGGRKAYEAGYTTSDIEAADAALIAAAVNALPGLLDEREALRKALRTALNQWRAYADEDRERGHEWAPIGESSDGGDAEAAMYRDCVAALARLDGAS